MRYVFGAILLIAITASARAQSDGERLTSVYTGFRLMYHGVTDTSEWIATSSVVGRTDQAGSERFGLVMSATATAAPVIEILGERGLLKGITASDLSGRSNDGSVKLSASDASVPGRYVQHTYNVRLAGGRNVRLVVKALATGDATSAHPFLVTYSLAGEETQKLALRLRFPFEGAADVKPGGFIVAARNHPAALAATVLPAPQRVEIAGNTIVVTSQFAELNGDAAETPMLWLHIDGAGGSTPSAARDGALAALGAVASATRGPNIIVVSATDKANVNPNDTVAMTLIYVNVGTQSASGVTLKNPVPEGTQYLASSAEGEGMQVEYEHANSENGHAGEISAVRWTMSGAMKPGEQRMARFKTIVR